MSAPPPLRRPLDGFAIAVMTALCFCWGLQQVAIKAAAPAMNPVLQVGLRSFLSGLLVAGFMVRRGESLSLRDGTFRAGAIAGLLFGAEFAAVSVGLNYTTAGHMTVFFYTAPIFTAIGLHFFVKGEHLTARQWWGVALAFAGIILGYSTSLFTPGGGSYLVGDALGILAGIFWAGTTLAIRATRLAVAPPTKILLYQLAGAALILLPLAWWSGYPAHVFFSPRLCANLAFQTLGVSFASYLIWFWLWQKYLVSRLSIFSFLTPFFGVALGVALLKEPLEPRFVLGAVFALVGITVVNATKEQAGGKRMTKPE